MILLIRNKYANFHIYNFNLRGGGATLRLTTLCVYTLKHQLHRPIHVIQIHNTTIFII
jgi:hypothetical protein